MKLFKINPVYFYTTLLFIIISCKQDHKEIECENYDNSDWVAYINNDQYIFHFLSDSTLIIRDYNKKNDSAFGWNIVQYYCDKNSELLNIREDKYLQSCYSDSIMLIQNKNGSKIKLKKYKFNQKNSLKGIWLSKTIDTTEYINIFNVGYFDFETMNYYDSYKNKYSLNKSYSDHSFFLIKRPDFGYEIIKIININTDSINARVVYGKENFDIILTKRGSK